MIHKSDGISCGRQRDTPRGCTSWNALKIRKAGQGKEAMKVPVGTSKSSDDNGF